MDMQIRGGSILIFSNDIFVRELKHQPSLGPKVTNKLLL